MGYNTKNVEFVPISSWNGDLFSSSSANMAWYNGPTLIQALDKLIVRRTIDKQPRVVVTDLKKVDDSRYTALGRVHGGKINVGVEVEVNQGKQKNMG